MSENTQAAEHHFNVHNIYVMDVSFEAPNTPHIFSVDWKPKLDFDLELGHIKIAEDVYEVVVHVTVKVTLAVQKEENSEETSEEVAFVVEVKQCGIFALSGYTDEQSNHILGTAAPGILFPYIREAVSNLVTKGGFPQLVLPPVNFESMYQKRLQEQAQQAAASNS